VFLKNILFVTYIFPPLAGAGVQRSLKFVKYLRHYQWEPIVLTSAGNSPGTKDITLLQEIPEATNIYRTPAYSIMRFWNSLRNIHMQKLVSFIDRYLLLPDGQIFWHFGARKVAMKIIREKKIDIIYTTSGPYSNHLVGLYLKNKYPLIKWVADFRDEWTTNPQLQINYYRYNKFRLMVERIMENRVCGIT